jgi:hypothetical protein
MAFYYNTDTSSNLVFLFLLLSMALLINATEDVSNLIVENEFIEESVQEDVNLIHLFFKKGGGLYVHKMLLHSLCAVFQIFVK